jgi:hypothetical protein
VIDCPGVGLRFGGWSLGHQIIVRQIDAIDQRRDYTSVGVWLDQSVCSEIPCVGGLEEKQMPKGKLLVFAAFLSCMGVSQSVAQSCPHSAQQSWIGQCCWVKGAEHKARLYIRPSSPCSIGIPTKDGDCAYELRDGDAFTPLSEVYYKNVCWIMSTGAIDFGTDVKGVIKKDYLDCHFESCPRTIRPGKR